MNLSALPSNRVVEILSNGGELAQKLRMSLRHLTDKNATVVNSNWLNQCPFLRTTGLVFIRIDPVIISTWSWFAMQQGNFLVTQEKMIEPVTTMLQKRLQACIVAYAEDERIVIRKATIWNGEILACYNCCIPSEISCTWQLTNILRVNGYPTAFKQLSMNFMHWFATLSPKIHTLLPAFSAGWATGQQITHFWGIMIKNFNRHKREFDTPTWSPYFPRIDSLSPGGVIYSSRYDVLGTRPEQLIDWVQPSEITLQDAEETDIGLSNLPRVLINLMYYG